MHYSILNSVVDTETFFGDFKLFDSLKKSRASSSLREIENYFTVFASIGFESFVSGSVLIIFSLFVSIFP
jgi:hypothetical protein